MRRPVLPALVLGLVLVVPGIAWAREAPAGLPYEMQVWPEGEPGQVLLIVGTQLPGSVALPATVRMALPPDSEIIWSGEIGEGGTETDVRRDFRLVPGSLEGTSVEFRAEGLRYVQYEALHSAVRTSDGRSVAEVRWRPSEPVASLGLTVRLPAGVSDVEISPEPVGEPQRNQAGETLYTLSPPSDPRNAVISVSYAPPRSGPPVAEGDGPDTATVVTILLVLLGITAGALWLAVRRSRQPLDVPTEGLG